MAIPQEIQTELQGRFGLSFLSSQAVGGGCIHNANLIKTDQGNYFLKYNHIQAGANFQAEEKGLAILAVADEIRTPKVEGSGATQNYSYLLMEFIESGGRARNYWEDFGRSLAKLHQHTQAAFGLDHDNYIGALPQSNQAHKDWGDFWVEERILPMVEMALRKGALPVSISKDFEKLYAKAKDLFPSETPALLHGDLWGGNILSDEKGQVCIIDPAVYYGHREMELAFMTLFDTQPTEFYQAYKEVSPLEPDFASRFDLYNLYPLLVHVNLFGGGYADSVKRILKAVL